VGAFSASAYTAVAITATQQ